MNINGISDYKFTDSAVKTESVSEEIRLRRLIQEDKKRLEKLDERTAEAERLKKEITDYEKKLTAGKQAPEEMSESEKKRRFDSFEECQTCKNRKYVDESDDGGVSFQTPTHVAPSASGAAVRSHENEHVVRNRSEAERTGREIVSQTVSVHTAICPECGKVYTSGGVTKTVTRTDNSEKFKVGLPEENNGKKALDIVA